MKSAKTFFMAAILMAGISVAKSQSASSMQTEFLKDAGQKSWIKPESTPVEKGEFDISLSTFSSLDSLANLHPFRPAVIKTFNLLGDSLYKYEYFYDQYGMEYGGNNVLSEIMYIWNETTQKWQNSMRLIRVLNEKRQLVFGYNEQGSGDQWTSRSRVSLKYDERGNRTEGTQASWTENGWFDNYRYKTEYDEQNRRISEIYDNRLSSPDWTQTSLWTWEYDQAGNLIKQEVQDYKNGNYTPRYLNEYEYDENGNETARQQSQFGKKKLRMESTYDDKGNLIKYLSFQYNDSTEDWQETSLSLYSYDTLSRSDFGLLLKMNDSTGIYDSVERFKMTYQGTAFGVPRKETKLTHIYNDTLAQWEVFAEQYWQYNREGNGNLTTYAFCVPIKNWPGNQSIAEENYTYDTKGNLIRQLFEDVSRDTIFDGSAITRTPTLDLSFTYDSVNNNGIYVKAAVKGSRDYVFINYNDNADQWGCADFESYAASIQYLDLQNFIEAESLEIDSTSVNMLVGDSTILHAFIVPDSASNTEIMWSVDNPEIACVDMSGKVYAFAEGTAIITAQSSYNPAIAATCTVTVAEPEDPTPPDPQANEENNKGDFRVWSRDQVLYVESSNEKDEIFVIDMNGRILYKGHSTEIPVENSGLYIVRQENNIQKTIVH